MQRKLSFLADARASAAAEMALILPLLLSLVFMMFEGAFYAWNEHKVVMGVRDAARYAGRLDFSTYVCPGATWNDPGSTKQTAIKNMARTGQIAGGSSRVRGWVDADITLTLECTSSAGGLYSVVGNNAPKVKVSANVLYPSIIGTTLGFSTTMRLGASAQSPVMGL